MSSYLVFIPTEHLPKDAPRTEASLRAVGLAGIIDPNFSALCCDFSGPEEKRGLLFYWQDDANGGAGLAMRPTLTFEANDWQPAKAYDGLTAGRFWLGKPKFGKVTPEALLRRKAYSGNAITLADGNGWEIPIARQLPHRYTIGGRVIKSEFREFYDATAAIYDLVITQRCTIAEFREAGFPFAVKALAMNYRVNLDVIDWLELLDDENVPAVCGATFEFEQLQKKTEVVT